MRFAKIGIVYALGQVLTKLISFILIPILTDELGAGGYGNLALADTILDFVTVIIGINIYSGYLRFYREYKEHERGRLWNTAFWFNVFTSAISVLIIVTTGRFFAGRILPLTDAYAVMILIVLRSVFQLLLTQVMCDYTLNYKIKSVVIVDVVCVFMNLVLSIYFVKFLKLGVSGVYLGYFLSYLSLFIVMSFVNIKRYKFEFDFGMLKNLLKFGGGLLPSNIAATVLTLSDRFFLSGMKSSIETGVYSMGYKFGMLIEPFYINPFKKFFTPYKFQIWKDADAKEKFNQYFYQYNLIGCIMMMGIAVFSRTAITVLSNSEFESAYRIVPLILVSYFVFGQSAFFSLGALLKNKTYLDSFVMIPGGIINIVLNIILIPKIGMYGAAVATIISYLVMNLIYKYFSRKYFEIKYEYTRVIRIYILTTIFYIIYFLGSLYTKRIFVDLSLACVTVLGYFISMFFFGFIKKQEALSLMSEVPIINKVVAKIIKT